MIYRYVRINTQNQSVESQKNSISCYFIERKLMIDEWIELERDFISARTKEELRARVAKGIKLGKPKRIIQSSMDDKDKEEIVHFYQWGVPIKKIIEPHLGYGNYLSLKTFINKCNNLQSENNNASQISILTTQSSS